jgi:hypothetical protein
LLVVASRDGAARLFCEISFPRKPDDRAGLTAAVAAAAAPDKFPHATPGFTCLSQMFSRLLQSVRANLLNSRPGELPAVPVPAGGKKA